MKRDFEAIIIDETNEVGCPKIVNLEGHNRGLKLKVENEGFDAVIILQQSEVEELVDQLMNYLNLP